MNSAFRLDGCRFTGYDRGRLDKELFVIIAIPSDAPGGLDAAISEHFGHCAAFTLVHVADGQVGEVKVVANGAHEQGGCMAPVRMLKALSVDALVSGGMGMRPLAGFQSVGIAVHFKEDARTVREGVQLFIDGRCRAFGKADTCGGGSGHCGGHGHHHEEPDRPPIEGKADVRRGRVITLDFVLKNAEGQVMDSSKDSGPMRYLQGSGVMASLEKAIEGLEAGGQVTVHLGPAECFGERDEGRVLDVPLDRLPPDLEVGDTLSAQDGSGHPVRFTVVEVGPETARLDGNHPLAGQAVIFDLTVRKVESALPEELASLSGH